MKPSRIVVENSLRVSRDGFDVEVRLPWYRGLPLSTVEVGEIRINGQTVDPNAVTLTVNGKARAARELANYYEENWYVLDSGYLHLPFPNPKKGESYEVLVTLVLYPPYIPGVPFRNSISQPMLAN